MFASVKARATASRTCKGIEFANGTIEFDVKGKDVQQQSFVGDGVSRRRWATMYDAIHFCPFTFRTDALRHDASAPSNTSLIRPIRGRSCGPSIRGRTRRGSIPPPDPNGWFHVRVVVASPEGQRPAPCDAKEPSLVVDQLSDRKKGLVGLWVGNASGGDFANVKIIPVFNVVGLKAVRASRTAWPSAIGQSGREWSHGVSNGPAEGSSRPAWSPAGALLVAAFLVLSVAGAAMWQVPADSTELARGFLSFNGEAAGAALTAAARPDAPYR